MGNFARSSFGRCNELNILSLDFALLVLILIFFFDFEEQKIVKMITCWIIMFNWIMKNSVHKQKKLLVLGWIKNTLKFSIYIVLFSVKNFVAWKREKRKF